MDEVRSSIRQIFPIPMFYNSQLLSLGPVWDKMAENCWTDDVLMDEFLYWMK